MHEMVSAFFPTSTCSIEDRSERRVILESNQGYPLSVAPQSFQRAPGHIRAHGWRFPSSRRYLWDRTPNGTPQHFDTRCLIPSLTASSALFCDGAGLFQFTDTGRQVAVGVDYRVTSGNRLAVHLKPVDRLCRRPGSTCLYDSTEILCSCTDVGNKEGAAGKWNGTSSDNMPGWNICQPQLRQVHSISVNLTPGGGKGPCLEVLSGELETVGATMVLTPLYNKRLHQWQVTDTLLSTPDAGKPMDSMQMGYLTMDQARSLVPLWGDDTVVYSVPIVGLWLKGAPGLQHPLVLYSCMEFSNSRIFPDKALQQDGSFLLLMVHEGGANNFPKCYECKVCGGSEKLCFSFQLMDKDIEDRKAELQAVLLVEQKPRQLLPPVGSKLTQTHPDPSCHGGKTLTVKKPVRSCLEIRGLGVSGDGERPRLHKSSSSSSLSPHPGSDSMQQIEGGAPAMASKARTKDVPPNLQLPRVDSDEAIGNGGLAERKDLEGGDVSATAVSLQTELMPRGDVDPVEVQTSGNRPTAKQGSPEVSTPPVDQVPTQPPAGLTPPRNPLVITYPHVPAVGCPLQSSCWATAPLTTPGLPVEHNLALLDYQTTTLSQPCSTHLPQSPQTLALQQEVLQLRQELQKLQALLRTAGLPRAMQPEVTLASASIQQGEVDMASGHQCPRPGLEVLMRPSKCHQAGPGTQVVCSSSVQLDPRDGVLTDGPAATVEPLSQYQSGPFPVTPCTSGRFADTKGQSHAIMRSPYVPPHVELPPGSESTQAGQLGTIQQSTPARIGATEWTSATSTWSQPPPPDLPWRNPPTEILQGGCSSGIPSTDMNTGGLLASAATGQLLTAVSSCYVAHTTSQDAQVGCSVNFISNSCHAKDTSWESQPDLSLVLSQSMGVCPSLTQPEVPIRRETDDSEPPAMHTEGYHHHMGKQAAHNLEHTHTLLPAGGSPVSSPSQEAAPDSDSPHEPSCGQHMAGEAAEALIITEVMQLARGPAVPDACGTPPRSSTCVPVEHKSLRCPRSAVSNISDSPSSLKGMPRRACRRLEMKDDRDTCSPASHPPGKMVRVQAHVSVHSKASRSSGSEGDTEEEEEEDAHDRAAYDKPRLKSAVTAKSRIAARWHGPDSSSSDDDDDDDHYLDLVDHLELGMTEVTSKLFSTAKAVEVAHSLFATPAASCTPATSLTSNRSSSNLNVVRTQYIPLSESESSDSEEGDLRLMAKYGIL